MITHYLLTVLAPATPPASAFLALADIKAYLRVDHDFEDALIQTLARAAQRYIERMTGLTLDAGTDDDVRLAALLLIGGWYLNREAIGTASVTAATGFAVDALLQDHRNFGFQ